MEDKSDTGAPPPIRLVTRLLAEMQTSILASGLRAFDGDLDRFVIFTLMLRQSLTRIEHDTAMVDPVRAISINSLAASLGRSFETVRRHINALTAAGLCHRTPGGMVVTDGALDRVDISDLMIVAHDAFVRMVEDMAALDLPQPLPRGDRRYRHETGVNAAVDIMLAVLATNVPAHREWMHLVLYSTILCANVRAFAEDPALNRRFADERHPVPRALLRPVTAGTVARTLGLPSSTVRRHAAALVDDGRVERLAAGLVVSKAWLNRPESVAVSRASMHDIRRILARTAAEGFPFDDPASSYMRGRPPLLTVA